jgi:hypothetical protein
VKKGTRRGRCGISGFLLISPNDAVRTTPRCPRRSCTTSWDVGSSGTGDTFPPSSAPHGLAGEGLQGENGLTPASPGPPMRTWALDNPPAPIPEPVALWPARWTARAAEGSSTQRTQLHTPRLPTDPGPSFVKPPPAGGVGNDDRPGPQQNHVVSTWSKTWHKRAFTNSLPTSIAQISLQIPSRPTMPSSYDGLCFCSAPRHAGCLGITFTGRWARVNRGNREAGAERTARHPWRVTRTEGRSRDGAATRSLQRRKWNGMEAIRPRPHKNALGDAFISSDEISFDQIGPMEFTLVLQPIPEPGTLGLTGSGLVIVGLIAWRRRRDGAARHGVGG